MLVDNITLTIKAGAGGNGAATFLSFGPKGKGGPDGGNGGNGGNIYFQGSNNINDLREFRFKKKITAGNGVDGKRKNLFGKNASYTIIYVPLGTRITDTKTGEIYEITDINIPILLAQGGLGGRGNAEFKSATNQSPLSAEDGTPGEEKIVLLELRLIADIGLIGLPNAGKSSLLAVLTNASPKIGNFPFTTLEPNIGMFGKYPIADIPGLIEGASSGKGLGVTFLKHIEKTKILVHCIEASENDVLKKYETVRQEFKNFNTRLLEKPEIILLTKTDLTDEKILKQTINLFKKRKKIVFACSIHDNKSIEVLKEYLNKYLK